MNNIKKIEEVSWEENKFDVDVITDSKIEKFNFRKNKFKDLQKMQNLCKKFYTNINYKLINKL